jgi:hypothetical protein
MKVKKLSTNAVFGGVGATKKKKKTVGGDGKKIKIK